jgi:hypothetical protein
MDHRKFLGLTQTLVLPYVGGLSVQAPDRPLRVAEPFDPGWWRFEVRGRNATPIERADPPALDDRPRLRGHLVGWWLFTSGKSVEHLLLPPEEEAAVLSPATGRHWHGDVSLFEDVLFEDTPEIEARRALEEGGSIADLRGLPPSLRAAWGFARLVAAAREAGATVSPRAALSALPSVADGSRAPWDVLSDLHRRVHTLGPQHWRTRSEAFTRARTRDDAQQRAAEALEAAGALLLASRHLGDTRFEVTFRFMGERFISVVDWQTLHVYDAGICLSGADELLGLDALPSVIREAIDNDALNITRR